MLRLQSLAVFAVVLAASTSTRADDLPAAERDKIEHLIMFVVEMRDAVFVRNGKEYDAAKEFIEKAASTSATSGKPYLIRFRDGKEVTSGEYLLDELNRF